MNRGSGFKRVTIQGRPRSTHDDGTMTMDLPDTPATDRWVEAARVALERRQQSAAAERTFAPVAETSQRAARPSSTGFPAGVRSLILERDRYACVRCGIPVDAGTIGYSLQHRDNRGMGGTTDPAINLPSNGIVLCGSGTTGCHGWVEEHPDEATGNGWAVLAWADPISVPVRYRHGWYLLDQRGGMQVIADGIIPNNGAHTIADRKDRT